MKAPRNGYSLGILQRLDIPHALRSLRDRFESLVMILQYQANILRHDHHLHFVGGDVHLAAHEHEVANLGPFLNGHLESTFFPISTSQNSLAPSSLPLEISYSSRPIRITDIGNFLHQLLVLLFQLVGLVLEHFRLDSHVDDGMCTVKESSCGK